MCTMPEVTRGRSWTSKKPFFFRNSAMVVVLVLEKKSHMCSIFVISVDVVDMGSFTQRIVRCVTAAVCGLALSC